MQKKSFEEAYSETLAELQALNNRLEKKSTVSPPKKCMFLVFITLTRFVPGVFSRCTST